MLLVEQMVAVKAVTMGDLMVLHLVAQKVSLTVAMKENDLVEMMDYC